MPGGKLDALLGLCETADCRRVRLLGYFGEASRAVRQLRQLPRRRRRRSTPRRRRASCCRASTARGQRFGAGHLIDVLRGEATDKVAQCGHDQLTTFGIGARAQRARMARHPAPVHRARPARGRPRRLRHAAADRREPRGAEGRAQRGAARLARAEAQRADVPRAAVESLAGPAHARCSSGCAPGGSRPRAATACRPMSSSTTPRCARSRARGPRRSTRCAASGVGARKLEAYGEDIIGLLAP